MQEDGMGHDRGAQNPGCQNNAFSPVEMRYNGKVKNIAPIRFDDKGLYHITQRYHAHHGGYNGFKRPETESLETQNQKCRKRCQKRSGKKRHAQQEIEPQGRAQKFGQVRGHCHQLHQNPHTR